jgi:hypothetical protein
LKNKIIYIAHPIGGDIEGNISKIKVILHDLNKTNPDIVPFAHYLVDLMVLDDNDPIERQRGITNDHILIKKGFIDEMWLYGDKISKGMIDEISLAEELGIPVIPKTEATKKGYKIITFY